MTNIPIVGELLSDMLTPIKEADRLLGEVMNLASKGVDWTGQELGEVGSALHNIELKIEALQKQLKGGDT